MTTAVPGLIKIGKTATNNYEQRMYSLEHDGYRNVTALKRAFAIEVEDYDKKEALLHTIFEKSQVHDTELFAVDINIIIQLLSSFEGTMVYPKSEDKEELFVKATENTTSHLIPDGTYVFDRRKKSDNARVTAKANVTNGCWCILKGARFGINEDAGIPQKARDLRATLPIDSNGVLLDDVNLGMCTPSFAGSLVINQTCDGWVAWKTLEGKPLDIYRTKKDSNT